jgi:CBS domain containing-hemolysin-like protein
VNTLSGLCVHLNDGRIPSTGAVLEVEGGVRLEILEASARRVRRARIRVPASASTETS